MEKSLFLGCFAKSNVSYLALQVCLLEFTSKYFLIFQKRLLFTDLFESAVGFLMFTAILLTWILFFAIVGEHLLAHVWEDLAVYNVVDRYGLTGWI